MMSEEIKEIIEIIEYFKDDIDYLEEELKYPNFKGRYITIRDKECEYLRKLLDYITNLQEEIKELKEDKSKMFETAVKNNNKLMDRIYNAIEFIEEHNIIGTNKEYLPTGIEKCYSLELMEILKGSDKE